MDLASLRMLVIGCGNMGAAIINGIVGRSPSAQIVALDPAIDRARSLLKHPDLVVLRKPDDAAETERFDLVLLAIKPQLLNQLADGIARLANGTLILSIVTGARLATLRTGLQTNRVIRAMPNLPAEIGQSVTAAFADSELTTIRDRMLVHELLACIGHVEWLSSEPDIDLVTSVSGCGPGYIFAFAETLIEAAIAEGLAPGVADRLVRQTFLGSAKLLASTTKTPADLKTAVASPKGTTEAGLSVLQHENALAQLLFRTVNAAHRRADELGN